MNKGVMDEQDSKQRDENAGTATDANEWRSGEPAGRPEDPDSLLPEQQAKIAELERKVEELQDNNLRKSAELDNVRKRVQRERMQVHELARISAVESFLPVNDDLQRTIGVLNEAGEKVAGLEEGIRMVAAKFEEILKQYGVEQIDQTGIPFDVDLHDAMMRLKPGEEDVESGTVLKIVENGYRLGDRTIRHAKVIVSE